MIARPSGASVAVMDKALGILLVGLIVAGLEMIVRRLIGRS